MLFRNGLANSETLASPLRELSQHGPAGRVRERRKRLAEAILHGNKTTWLIN